MEPTSCARGVLIRVRRQFPAMTSTVVTETVNAIPGGGFYAAAASPLSVGATPESVAVGDFNRDGIADMAIVNLGDSTVSVLLGDGSGGFNAASGSPFPAGSLRRAVAVGDFDGDGNPDLAIMGGRYRKLGDGDNTAGRWPRWIFRRHRQPFCGAGEYSLVCSGGQISTASEKARSGHRLQ